MEQPGRHKAPGVLFRVVEILDGPYSGYFYIEQWGGGGQAFGSCWSQAGPREFAESLFRFQFHKSSWTYGASVTFRYSQWGSVMNKKYLFSAAFTVIAGMYSTIYFSNQVEGQSDSASLGTPQTATPVIRRITDEQGRELWRAEQKQDFSLQVGQVITL